MSFKFHFKKNGERVSRKEFRRGPKVGGIGVPMVSQAYSDSKPLVSDGLGCMSNQVGDMRKEIESRGITGANVLENGQIEFSSRRARKEVCAMRGLHDADGGFGDG